MGAGSRDRRHDPDHQGERKPVSLARLDPRRRVRGRLQGRHPPRRRQAVARPPGWGLGSDPGRRAREPGHRGCGARPRWPAHLVRPTDRELAVQRQLPAAADRRVRPGDRPQLYADLAVRLRLPADHLAGRSMAGVRHPVRGGNGPAPARPGNRRGVVARLPGPAGRAGVDRRPRHPAGHGVHPGLARARRLLRGQDLAHPGGRERAHRGAVPGRGGARPGSGPLRGVSDRGRAHLHREGDPGRGALPRRQPPGVQCAEPAVRDGLAGGRAAASGRRLPHAGPTYLVAGRSLGGLGELG